MRHKFFTLIIALVSSAGSIFASTKVGDLYYILNASNKTAEVTYYEGSYYSNYPNLTTVNIPASIEYDGDIYSVISIGENAFTGCSSLKSVVIPNSVLNIKEWAFSECSRLSSVDLGENVVNIGGSCFEDCSSLSSISIPNSVISIGSGVFSKCTLLSSITIPNSVVNMEGGVFSGCSNLISVVLPEQITKIGDVTFKDCKSLVSIELPNGIDTIGNSAFSQCEKLSSINIPSGVTYIGDCAFSGCKNLISVIIPNNVEGIEWSTFSGCTNLTSVEFPDSLIYIKYHAFSDCVNLTSLNIPNKVELIDSYAFANDSNLTSLTIGSGVTDIGGSAFENCYKLKNITCYAAIPPSMGTNMGVWQEIIGVFDDVVFSNAFLYVPENSVETYKTADQWDNFAHIYPIQYASEIDSANVSATTTNSNSVILEWPEVSGADSYIIDIKQQEELVCTLNFDAQGKLVSLNYAAPSRNRNKRNVASATQTNKGWQYILDGLDYNSQYSYTITAKNGASALFTQTIMFATTSPEAIINIDDNKDFSNTKILRDGQIFILRGDKTYTLTGQEIN